MHQLKFLLHHCAACWACGAVLMNLPVHVAHDTLDGNSRPGACVQTPSCISRANSSACTSMSIS